MPHHVVCKMATHRTTYLQRKSSRKLQRPPSWCSTQFPFRRECTLKSTRFPIQLTTSRPGKAETRQGQGQVRRERNVEKEGSPRSWRWSHSGKSPNRNKGTNPSHAWLTPSCEKVMRLLQSSISFFLTMRWCQCRKGLTPELNTRAW